MIEWIDIKERTPNRGQYVLVQTKYCKYPATVAIWSGSWFNSVDNIKIENTENVYWAEISNFP